MINNSFAHQWLWWRLALLVVGNNPLSIIILIKIIIIILVITAISNSSAHQWLWRRLALLVVGNNPLSGWFWCRAGRQENTANQCSCQNDKKTKKIGKKRKRLGSDKNTIIGILKMVKQKKTLQRKKTIQRRKKTKANDRTYLLQIGYQE